MPTARLFVSPNLGRQSRLRKRPLYEYRALFITKNADHAKKLPGMNRITAAQLRLPITGISNQPARRSAAGGFSRAQKRRRSEPVAMMIRSALSRAFKYAGIIQGQSGGGEKGFHTEESPVVQKAQQKLIG